MAFATPEDAALDGFGRHARVVLSGIDGADAGVLLLTDGWGGYPYLVVCSRTPDGWVVGSTGGGCSWTLTDEDAETGVLACWGGATGEGGGPGGGCGPGGRGRGRARASATSRTRRRCAPAARTPGSSPSRRARRCPVRGSSPGRSSRRGGRRRCGRSRCRSRTRRSAACARPSTTSRAG